MAKKSSGKISNSRLRRSNQLTIKNSRTGEIKGTIYTKNTQYGSPNHEIKDNPDLTTYGVLRSPGGISGSLQHLVDGRSYLVGGNGVNITSSSNGQVNISVGSISPADTLTMGDGFTPYGSSYNGTAPISVDLLTESSKGLSVSSQGLKLNVNNLNTATNVTPSWQMIVSNGGDPYSIDLNTVLGLAVDSNIILDYPLTINSAGGLRDTLGGNQYDNTAQVDLALKLESNKGLSVSSSGLKIDPSNLGSTAVDPLDKVLIGDTSSGDQVKYVTAQDIANLSPAGTLNYPLSIGSGLDPDGTDYDGSNPITISVKSSDSTISVNSSGISVEKTPNSLSFGNGITGNNFDGSSPEVAEVEASPNRGVQVTGAGVELDIEGLPFSQPASVDYMVFYDVALSEERKNTFGTFMNNIIQPEIDASRDLGTPFSLEEGVGISPFSFNGSTSGVTVEVDDSVVPLLANDNTYTGKASFSEGLSGSLTHLPDGTSYLVAGSNILIQSSSNGQVVISSTASGAIITGSISNVTQDIPGLVTTIEDHNLGENQGLTITEVVGMTELNGNKYYADVVSYNQFALYEDEDLVNPLDTTVFNPYISGGEFVAESGGNVKSDAPFITWGDDVDLINERVLTGGPGISLTNNAIDKIILETDPKKISYIFTGSLPELHDLTVPGIDFSDNKKNWNKTDIYLNGLLLLSGTDKDYVLGDGDSEIRFYFELVENDSLLVKLN